jgi:hypothetical protein
MSNTAIFLKRALLLSSISIVSAIAGPADYIYTPVVEFGEREIDLKYGSSALPNAQHKQAIGIGFGMGVTEHWFTEVAYKDKRNGGNTDQQLEWENKFQLTEAGEYAVDVGMMTEIEVLLTSGRPWTIKVGGLFQIDIRRVQLNGNLILKQDKSSDVLLNYQLQAKYRLQSTFEFGVQGFGSMGKWNDLSQQSKQAHFLGPAVFGKLNLGNRRAIKYNAAWLLGTSSSAPDDTLRVQVEYEF